MSRIQELQDQVLQNPNVQAAVQWYQSQNARDQLIVKLVACFVALALAFVIVYAPLIRDHRSLQQQLDKSLSTYNMLAENAGKFGSVNSVSSAPKGTLLSKVTQQARLDGIALSRYEQDGNGLRIWLDRVAFDDAMGWLEKLEVSSGIRVSQINVDRAQGSGRVDIRATLSDS